MIQYVVRIPKSAQEDIFQAIEYISQIYKAPLTAEKYLRDLYDAIFTLEYIAESTSISTKADILKYGLNARSIVFKKLIIVYTVHTNIVLVQAVIPGKIVKR